LNREVCEKRLKDIGLLNIATIPSDKDVIGKTSELWVLGADLRWPGGSWQFINQERIDRRRWKEKKEDSTERNLVQQIGQMVRARDVGGSPAIDIATGLTIPVVLILGFFDETVDDPSAVAC
jgi:hypothetical protein